MHILLICFFIAKESDFVKKNEPIRIGIIMGKWYGGGVEAVMMNYYSHINRDIIQFDFICDSDSTNIPYDKIKKLGGRVILCPPYQNISKYIRELKKIFKKNQYEIVHSNINALSVFPLYAAKKAGVPIRIAHSHSTSNKKEWKKNIVKNLLKPLSKKYATHYFACTEHAGRWLFGNKKYNNGEVFIVNNGVDLNDYIYSEKLREEKRLELGYEETDIVIGHIGRFVKQKNHEFIIDLFNELHKDNENYKLLLLGQGPLKNEIQEKVNKLGIENSVIFLGQKSDANEYYQAMDLFLFPSLYEGLGMVFVEAQTSGLPSIASTEVPKIAEVSDKAIFIGLNKSIDVWKKQIEKIKIGDRKVDLERIKKSGYDIKTEAKKLENKYLELKGNEANGKNTSR